MAENERSIRKMRHITLTDQLISRPYATDVIKKGVHDWSHRVFKINPCFRCFG